MHDASTFSARAQSLVDRYSREIAALKKAEGVALRRNDAVWLAHFGASRVRYERAIARIVRLLQRDTIPAPAWRDEEPTCDDIYAALVTEDRPLAEAS